MQESSQSAHTNLPVVCFVNTTREWGGGEKWHYDMAVLLKEKGYPVLTITSRKSELQKKLLETGIPNQAFNINNVSFLNPFIRRRLASFFKTNSVDAVIMNLPSDLKTAGPAAKKAGTSKIIYRRGSAIPVKNSCLNRYLYRKIIDLVLVNSKATKNTILSQNQKLIHEEKIHVLYNGLHLANYECKEKSLKQNRPIVIGNLGRFVKQKAQHRFIELARELIKKEIPFKIVLGGEGELKKDIIKKIDSEGLDAYFELPGFISESSRFMQQLDVFVLTSYWEGFGYVLAEAMACCKPVIGFNVSSNPELIREGQNGFLIEEGNIESLTQKIEHLYLNPSEIHTMGRQGRRIAEQEFDISQVGDHLIRILEQ